MTVPAPDTALRLRDRRARLVATIDQVSAKDDLRKLLGQVDAALHSLSVGAYGICEICHESIEEDRLRVDPLTTRCSSDVAAEEQNRAAEDHRDSRLQWSFHTLGVVALTGESPSGSYSASDFTGSYPKRDLEPVEAAPMGGIPGPSFLERLSDAVYAAVRVFRRKHDHQMELEKDFSRASNLQAILLPKRGLCLDGWQTYYNYTPAGHVGGDYCDLVRAPATGDFFFFFGDAVGKGIAGSMIASQLHAVFRALLSVALPLKEMFERANRLFCESVVPDYYATVICGRASSSGTLELVNAGHLPPFILRSGQAIPVPATGVPLGLFYTSTYDVARIQLAPGETLVFYTDGITEARNRLDAEYGPERFADFVARNSHLSPEELVHACVSEVTAFTANPSPSDDRTVMALRHVPGSASRVDGGGVQLNRAAGEG